MSRVCCVSRKKPLSGHNVSHANNKTKRRFLPNLQRIAFPSEGLGRVVRLRVSTRALQTIRGCGGIDAFLKSLSKRKASGQLLRLKKDFDRLTQHSS